MCDVAHAHMVEQIEADARARWIGLASIAAAGVEIEEMTPAQARVRVEDWLDGTTDEVGPPPGMDREQWELRQALGVA